MALNPYEFWRAQKSRVAICANPMPTRCPLFSLIEATFLDHSPPPPPLTRKKGGRHVGGAPPPQTPPGEIVPIELLTKPRGRYLIVTKQQKPIQFFTNSLKIWKGGGGRLIKTCPGTQPTLCTASSINRKPIKCWTKSGELFIKDIVWSVKIAGKSWKKKVGGSFIH